MFLGIGRRSSSIHLAAWPGACAIASPNVLVVLVCTNAPTPARVASSSSTNVPVTLVSTKSCRLWVTTCGLCSVAVCSTARTPVIASRTTPRSTIEPTTLVNGEGLMSSPRASSPRASSRRISASPKWPALPVTRTVMAPDSAAVAGRKSRPAFEVRPRA